MRRAENPFQQQQNHGQIELQVRPDDHSAASPKSSDRSVLLSGALPRSDEFVNASQHSNGAHGHPSVDRDSKGSSEGAAFSLASESFNKVVDDVRPLLATTGSPSSGEEDGVRRDPSKGAADDRADGASLRSAVFNLSTTIIGAGIMALPATMRVLGLLPGVVIIFIMGVFSEVSLEMVVRYTTQTKTGTYGGMVYEAWGNKGRFLSQIAIIINNGGVLIVYMIIMGDVMSGSKDHVGLFEGWVGAKGWWTSRSIVLLLTMIFVLGPLASLKRIDSLEISSAISVALALVFVLLSAGITLIKLMQGNLTTPRFLPSFASKKAVLDLLTVIPIMTNAFVCQFNVPPIYSELRDRTAPRMNKVGRISIGLCVAVYTTTALSGYLLFGELTESDVLSNFDTDLGIAHSHFWNDAIRVGYVVHLFFVFPVIHFSFRETLDSLLFPKAPALPESNLRFALLTLVPLSVIYAGSTLIPNIWVAFKFTGATTGLALGFTFPALVAIKTKGGGKTEQRLAWGILVMAVIVSTVGVTTQIYSFASGES